MVEDPGTKICELWSLRKHRYERSSTVTFLNILLTINSVMMGNGTLFPFEYLRNCWWTNVYLFSAKDNRKRTKLHVLFYPHITGMVAFKLTHLFYALIYKLLVCAEYHTFCLRVSFLLSVFYIFLLSSGKTLHNEACYSSFHCNKCTL